MTEPKDDKGESDMDTDDETRKSELEEEGRRLLDVTESPTRGQPPAAPGSNAESMPQSPGRSVNKKLGRLSKSNISSIDIPSVKIVPVPDEHGNHAPLGLQVPLSLPGTSKQAGNLFGSTDTEIPGVPTDEKNNRMGRILSAKGQVPLPVPPPPATPLSNKELSASLLYC
jgi:hypothetical protein